MNSSIAPHDPFVPEILVGDTGKPLCCLECGRELELRCAEGHKHTGNVGALPPIAAATTRPCAKCSQPFEPRPWQRICNNCQPKRGTNAARNYKPKACACGATFNPTGPRDVRCPTCKGVPA